MPLIPWLQVRYAFGFLGLNYIDHLWAWSGVSQTSALALQSVPPLPMFIGDKLEEEETSFDSWLEERVVMVRSAKASSLEGTFVQKSFAGEGCVLQVLPTAPAAIAAFNEWFKPMHSWTERSTQGYRWMSRWRIKLGLRKSFPSLDITDFDQLLKDRFFQALLSKWHQKLGADESFTAL